MRRRLTLAIVAVVAVALVVSGLVSLLLVSASERRRAERDITREAGELALGIERVQGQAALQQLSRFLKLKELQLVQLRPDGEVVGTLPAGVNAPDIRPNALLNGRSIHGRKGNTVYAAAPVRTTRAGAVILTRQVGIVPSVAGYFLISAGVALLLAVVVGNQLGRRIARPLQEAEEATRRIAEGDLDASVPVRAESGPELASLATSINTMAESLAHLRGLERQFLLSVSHDLRTPLTSIRGFAEAIADGAAADTNRAAEIIASESRRLERLVGDLLDLAKLEARTFSFHPRPIDLGEVVTDTADGFGPAARAYDISLTVDARPDQLTVDADPDRLAQVVANLVENAMKFASTRIVVRIEEAPEGGGNRIVVEDDGPGIAASDLPRVFERLYTSARTPARQVGSGLGLAIVAELTAAMGGTCIAESPVWPRGGTRLAVTLPAAPSVGGNGRPPTNPTDTSEPSAGFRLLGGG